MTLKFNSLVMHEHNGWRLPRFVFHGSHLVLGLPVALLGFLGFPGLVLQMLTISLIIVDKLVWLHWGVPATHYPWLRVIRKLTVVWHPFNVTDWWDFLSDALLTALGATLFLWGLHGWHAWLDALVVFYALGTFNGE